MPGTPTEARAKRTHARRSCDVCKVRKTRCELPDLEVPAGPDPLPTDKACHRCRVLALPCIVDDSARKQRKRTREEEVDPSRVGGSEPAGTQPNGSTTKRRGTKANGTTKHEPGSSSSTPVDRPQGLLNHSLDVIHGISPMAKPPASLHEASRGYVDTRTSPEQVSSLSSADSMKLHGRPAELTCAMLKVAYGKIHVKRVGPIDEEDLDLIKIVDEKTRNKLEGGFLQLRTYHPHLDPMSAMFSAYEEAPNSPIALLLATVVYVCTLSLPPDTFGQNLRSTLQPYILHLRNQLLLHQPRSFPALQALELCAVHLPLGTLPLQQTNLRTLAVARGQMNAAIQLMSALQFSSLVEQVITGPGMVFAFECSDIWLWLGLVADQAAITLEDLAPQRPDDLYRARSIADEFTDYAERSNLWQDGIRRTDVAGLVGRLTVCDKLARLDEVHTTTQRIRGALEASATNPHFDPVREIINEFERYEKRLVEVDRRHEIIMNILSEYSQGVESGCLAYRTTRRRYESNKIYVTGLRMLMATHYLPGSPYAYPNLPPGLPVEQAVAYAISRAFNPADIIRFITDTAVTKTSVEAVWDYGRRRGINTEECLASCAAIGQNLLAGIHSQTCAIIIPHHDIICIANESAKVLIEMEAGTIQILRSTGQLHKAFRARSWLVVMQQVSQTMRSIGELCVTDGLGGDTVANGCSNLIGSMVRTAENWTQLLEKEQATMLGPGVNGDEQVKHEVQATESRLPPYVDQNGIDPGDSVGSNGTGGLGTPIHPPHAYEAHRTPVVAAHQQYVTSDRWMAGADGPTAPGHASQSQQPPPPPARALAQAPIHPSQAQSQSQGPGQLPEQHMNHPSGPGMGSDQAHPQTQTQHGVPSHPYQPGYSVNHSGQGQAPAQGSTSQHPHPDSQHHPSYPTSALDQLLSQMFNYNLPPAQQVQPAHHHGIQTHPSTGAPIIHDLGGQTHGHGTASGSIQSHGQDHTAHQHHHQQPQHGMMGGLQYQQAPAWIQDM